jgi:hypothetical protein
VAPQNPLIVIVKFLGLAVLLGLGIATFFLREDKPQVPSAEILALHNAREEQIIKGEYLVLISPVFAEKISSILDPLNLEVKMPLLNWVLVGKKGNNKEESASPESSDADDSKAVLASLLQHKGVLEAHHNIKMASTSRMKDTLAHGDLRLLTQVGPGSDDIHIGSTIPKDLRIAVVDEFLQQKQFTFAERFDDCRRRVTFFDPYPSLAKPKQDHNLPHGELSLLALKVCEKEEPLLEANTPRPHVLAIERPSLGHAQSFLAALWASGIDVCRKSIVKCPAGFSYEMVQRAVDVLLLPFGATGVELLQFSADMMKAMAEKNVTVVTAAGNDSENAGDFFPSGSPGVINVGSLGAHGGRAYFSNWGSKVDLLATGEDIHFAYPNAAKIVEGTSLAAAHVAYAAALLKAVNPSLLPRQIEKILRVSATPMACKDYCHKALANPSNLDCLAICCDGNISGCGAMALNTEEALRLAKNQDLPWPILAIEPYYSVFRRYDSETTPITIKNQGDVPAEVAALTNDANIVVTPSNFTIPPHGQTEVMAGFKREPFRRQTQKISFVAQTNDGLKEKAEGYIEYLDKE